MKHKHHLNFHSSNTASIKKVAVATLIISILFVQPIMFVNVAYALSAQAQSQVTNIVTNTATNVTTSAINSQINSMAPASSGIAGKCVSQVVSQKVTAYAAGVVIAVIGAALTAGQTALAVPSNDWGVSSGANLQSGEGGATTVMSWIKPMTDCLIHEASQLMIDNLRTAVNGAIRDGLHGSPNYSANTNQFLSNLSSMVSGQLRNQINGIALCDFTGNGSFKQRLSNNIALSNRQTNSSYENFNQRVTCPFPGASAQNFYNDFNQGGWSAFETSLSDRGNPFGTSLIASQELATRQEETQKLAEDQLAQGNGYYPVIDEATCVYPEGLKEFLDTEGDANALANAQRLYCKVVTPGKAVADTASKAATSAWDQLNVSGALGKTMEGFASEQAANAMTGIFK